MISKAICALLLSAVVSAEIVTEKGVLVLNDDNFDAAVAANEFLLVEFYAPWCGHCKKLAPEWEKAAAALVGEEAKLAKVDATVATGLAERFAIRGFPTIHFFKNGKQIEYGGGRVSNEIVSWVKKQSGPAAKTISTPEELVAAQETDDAIVVGYFSSLDSASAKAFLSIAGADDVLSYFISSSDQIKEKLAVSGDSVVILKPFDDKRADLSLGDSFDGESVMKFIVGNSAPLVQTFSQEAAKKIFSSPVQKHCLFFTDSAADHHAPVVSSLTSVAEAFKGQVLVVNVPATEDRVLDYFGITKDTLPALVVVDMSGEGQMKKYPFDGDLKSSDSVSAHVSAVLSGSVKPTLKSEAVSPEDTTSDVVVLRGSSFNELVLENEKDVLVEFYAPWCGHCKKLAPTYDELGAKFRSNDNIVIAKMDATANEVDVPGMNVKGFPTLYFFPGKDKTPVKYDGGRELEDFVSWIEENASNDAKHDEL
mmetsp:Transcript_24655/g.36317  ORF Transcript_24655/g.36317 Transcript_24655/m.36317 type:complete len:480 (-) Transcript_24655:154-1593(-)|eukprot:CAMPEP_0185024436 /NCGR_PEP_ID=MMETSP1103-20130426/7493_1 /TAXON_ID=36769 /ORGANISM="Paraphysomonas bandaiensis, Strain Caron Lab Isolate" /LENGTH=479 /DNA_ID=CAMNT_0027557401 /DNA_START=37 /DNA_END=1476 /DNA_ORIENTATION=+